MSALTPLRDEKHIAIEYECVHSISGSSPFFRSHPQRPIQATTIEIISLFPTLITEPQLFYGYNHCHILKLKRAHEIAPNYNIEALLASISDVQKCIAYANACLKEEKAPVGKHILFTQIGVDKALLKYFELLLAKKINS